jgi:stearoyl-CoA desaturase (delta-9 desaturase)
MARFQQFLMAFGCTTAAQKGPLWWAGHHRVHHRYADTDQDIHSPQRGFWWSQVGWILCDKYGATEYDEIKDFAKYPELRFINKHDWIGPWALGTACFLIGGWSGLVVGFFASTIVLWHTTFFVNSLACSAGGSTTHPDTSRNSLFIALITGGEAGTTTTTGTRRPRQGFRWWQIDTTYYGLRLPRSSASCTISGSRPRAPRRGPRPLTGRGALAGPVSEP